MSSCDRNILFQDAACFADLPANEQYALMIQLLCDINAGGGGGGGVTSIIAGDGISVDQPTGAVTVTNAGVTSIIAGTGISVDQATGAVTISSSGGGGGASNFFVPAAAMIPKTTAGCGINSFESTTNDVNYDTNEFDPGTVEYANFIWMFPNNWDLGTFTAKVVASSASGTGDVVWGVSARVYASGDTIDQASGTAQEVTQTISAAGAFYTSSATSAITAAGTPAVDLPVIFTVYRNATSGSDTLAGDASFEGLIINYTAA